MVRSLAAGTIVAGVALILDVGIGRRIQRLGPLSFTITAPTELVFDVIASAYLGRTPRGLQEKLQVWERGSDMALAAHFTAVSRMVATTVETVRFERPHAVHFRLVRGPVPHVRESFELCPADAETELTWSGELGTDFWALGRLWGRLVARQWEHAVTDSIASVKAEAERRAA
jgi:hypothetical protein